MCGISGIMSLDGRPIEPGVLQEMNDRLRHRGPDGEGFLFVSRAGAGFRHALVRKAAAAPPAPRIVGLGHRRLAILDLSDRGLQPMSAADGAVWIVFNGEIYNYRDIRHDLERRCAVFTTDTDTEVLLRAYLHYGEECLERLEGMFAFAIWDARRGALFCARDRLGIKPFYYATPKGAFVFGSEVKALLACPLVRPVPDDAAVLDFLVHGNCDYAERTVLADVHSLPGGHSLSLDLATGEPRVRAYWRLSVHPQTDASDAERIHALRGLLLDSIRGHLRSDVRAGSCLSGGLDSSAIVSLVGKIRKEHASEAESLGELFNTFTSCFDEARLDERQYALPIVEAVGATSHLVFPKSDDFWTSFEKLAWHQDMPFGSIGMYAQWCVMRAAREAGVKVLLDGQGGDEVFGGYAKFRYAYVASSIRRRRVGLFAREIAAMLRQGDRSVLDIRKGYRYLSKGLRRVLGVDSLMRGAIRGDWDGLLAGASAPANRVWQYVQSAEDGGSAVQRVQADDLLVDTLPQWLRSEDRNSMAFSIEARVPLLDHRVVEYGLNLPDHLKIQRGWSKYAIREALRGDRPEYVRLRKSKMGFVVPDRQWLAEDLRGPVREKVHADLRCSRYINPGFVREWYDSPTARRANEESYMGLMRILSLEMWMRGFGVN
jgi:asparagine synthase (glutamine-hydrolysing)